MTELSKMSEPQRLRNMGTHPPHAQGGAWPWDPSAGRNADGGNGHPRRSAWWTRPRPVQSGGTSLLWSGQRAHPHPHCQGKRRGRHWLSKALRGLVYSSPGETRTPLSSGVLWGAGGGTFALVYSQLRVWVIRRKQWTKWETGACLQYWSPRLTLDTHCQYSRPRL